MARILAPSLATAALFAAVPVMLHAQQAARGPGQAAGSGTVVFSVTLVPSGDSASGSTTGGVMMRSIGADSLSMMLKADKPKSSGQKHRNSKEKGVNPDGQAEHDENAEQPWETEFMVDRSQDQSAERVASVSR